MPIALQRHESHWLIGLEGRIAIESAAELKQLLLEWLAAGKDLELDLQGAEEIDITIMQLLWAAGREAARTGAGIVGRASNASILAVRDAGFAQMPWLLAAG
ncbi:MAG: STAS domain-containing protein [Bryobacteraceae bacterium]|jgi:anti-anti-sigma regulatory factor